MFDVTCQPTAGITWPPHHSIQPEITLRIHEPHQLSITAMSRTLSTTADKFVVEVQPSFSVPPKDRDD